MPPAPGKVTGQASPSAVQIRKYPNRRYYDVTHSRHVTLEDIHQMILDGQDVVVSDSRTGEDLTAKVLAQIIIERDPLKLEAFPAAMLHRVIRANEQLVSDFIDKYFSRALSAFLESKQAWEHYLRQSLGLATTNPLTQPSLDWLRLFTPAPAPAPAPGMGEWNGRVSGQPTAPEGKADRRRASARRARPVATDTDLQAQVQALRRQIAQLQAQRRRPARRKRPRP